LLICDAFETVTRGLSRMRATSDHRLMKLNGALVSLFVMHTCWAANVTYLVSENAGACHEVRIPKWTRPANATLPWPTSTWGCEYDIRSPGLAAIYIGLSCGSPSYWRMKERYMLDLANPQNIGPVDDGSWEAAAVLEPGNRRPLEAASYELNGLQYRNHLFPKSGANWDLYGKALGSPGESRVAVYSYDGIVERSYEGSRRPERFNGTYWTEIYDVASGKRLVQIHGRFQGVDLTELQGKSYWYAGRFFLEPLEVNGMRRLLICDVDAAARSSDAAEVDAPVPLSRAKPYLNHTRSHYQLRFFNTDSPQAQITAFRDEPELCPGTSDMIKSVNVTAALDVQVAGTYWLELSLQDRSGRPIGLQFGEAEVHAGKDEIKVSFPGDLLRLSMRSDGPFTIVSGQLTRHVSDGQFLVQNVEGGAVTRAYSIGRIASRCPSDLPK